MTSPAFPWSRLEELADKPGRAYTDSVQPVRPKPCQTKPVAVLVVDHTMERATLTIVEAADFYCEPKR